MVNGGIAVVKTSHQAHAPPARLPECEQGAWRVSGQGAVSALDRESIPKGDAAGDDWFEPLPCDPGADPVSARFDSLPRHFSSK